MAVDIDPSEVAEAVKEELNSSPGSFSQAFTAQRVYDNTLKKDKMGDTLHVMVLPAELDSQPLNRGKDEELFSIDIGIMKKVGSADLTEVDPLVKFVKEIKKFLRKRPLATLAGARWTRTQIRPVYSLDQMIDRTFVSAMRITYRLTG